MKKYTLILILVPMILFLFFACKKKQNESPGYEPALKIDVKTQLFPSSATTTDTIQAKLGAICIMDIAVFKGKSAIKQVSVSRTNLSNGVFQVLKDTTYNTQNEMVKLSISSNMGNITGLWKYELIARDESNNTVKKYIHIRVGQNCPSLSLSFLGFTNADSNRIKVQGTGLSTGTVYQYSYDNGISWTYTNEFTYKTSGTKTIYARNKDNPACVGSTTVSVTGKKILTHTIQLGAELNTTYPNFYDVESKNTHFYSTAFANQNFIDWVYRTYSGKAYLFSPKSAADSNYYNMNTWTTRLASKFFNAVSLSEYNNTVSSIEIKAAQRGGEKDISPVLGNQVCIPFLVVNPGNIVKANGIACVKDFQAGSGGYATFELKYYLIP